MTPLVSLEIVKFQLLDLVNSAIGKLLLARGKGCRDSEPNVFKFLAEKQTCDDPVVQKFAQSLREDLAGIFELLGRVQRDDQLELFSQRLDRYKKALADVDFETDPEESENFFLELSYHLSKDLENYVYYVDEPEQVQEALEFQEADFETASFGLCGI